MQTHKIYHRFVTKSEGGQTEIRTRKAFDVAVARKMLREGETLAVIGEAFGMGARTVRSRLRALGLSYLITDPVRISAVSAANGRRSRK